jgi:hypothetical protein
VEFAPGPEFQRGLPCGPPGSGVSSDVFIGLVQPSNQLRAMPKQPNFIPAQVARGAFSKEIV